MTEVTNILSKIREGDGAAADQLLPLVYDELRKLAALKMSLEHPGQTIEATALVHEAYLRLVDGNEHRNWDSRGHFFAAAATAMRRILVDNARRKKRVKHGGDFQRLASDNVELAAPEIREDLVALDLALDRLKSIDPAAVELVQLRYFAGLSIAEAAAVLGVSPRSADRLWAYGRAWLRTELSESEDR
ncbi:ECF-type sigma factor [Stieleria sp.]|uniref:RNA polymerase sigma factor SigL n=1 Tax=Stieleria magnilauensis TaxID=2527963 RepID=A0ABX5XS85_9BACT|nr:RNA polymerase sigma factor SigL [Planctomycetes bacterium TBK1r]